MPDGEGVFADADVTSTAPAYDGLFRIFMLFGLWADGTVPVSQVHFLAQFVGFWEGVDDGVHFTTVQRSTPRRVTFQPPDPRQVPPKLQPQEH